MSVTAPIQTKFNKLFLEHVTFRKLTGFEFVSVALMLFMNLLFT